MTSTPPPGSQIGPYRITREIGRGGMGVVYLARDTKLDRDVAIKALPEELAEDSDRLTRFEREAKTLAQLNHQNVAGIHGIEEQDGQKYLILEYVEGETLADRLDRGPLPVDEAMELGVEIAAGVEAAHEAGVIHRDLKPENVKITPDGKVKVLDFGLARTDDGASGSSVTDAAAASATRRSPTIAGTILGTAAYMSPEQARGRRVDKRTDIWSFGVMLYEMLVGSCLFQGETATDTIGAVLHKDFSLDGIPRSTPRMVRHVLQRCLERDKTRRFLSIGDARIELEDALKRMEAGDRDEFGLAQSGRRAWVWPVLAACFALTTLGCLGLWITKPTAPNDEAITGVETVPQPTTPSVLSVQQITDFSLSVWGITFSPDAATVAYGARDIGQSYDIHSLRVGGARPLNLTGNSEITDVTPAFSPDGESIAYVSLRGSGQGGIYLMGATGESPRRIAEMPSWDPAWSPDGRSLVYTTTWWTDVYARHAPGELWIIDVATRERRKIDTSHAAKGMETDHWSSDAVSPAWSPDGTRIAFWGLTGGTRDIFTVSTTGGDVIRITDDEPTDWNPIWSLDGRSIWFLSDRGGQAGLWSITLDDAGRPDGEPRPIMLGPGRVRAFSRSADGRSIVALVGSGRHLIERVRFDPETERFVGSQELLLESSSNISSPDISRDGQWIAYHSAPPLEDITVMKLDGTGRRRLTEGAAKDRVARWSPDGKRLYYHSNENGNYQLWTVDRDSAEARVVPIEGVQSLVGLEISTDGTRIAFTADPDEPLQLANFAEDGSVTDVRATPDGFIDADRVRWSPDDRWIKGVLGVSGRAPVCTVLETETDSLIPVRKPDGEDCNWQAAASWIDATRLLVQDGDAERAFVFDVVSGESRWVEDSPTGLGRFITFHPDGWLYTQRDEDSSNLWLVTLEGPGHE